MLNIASKGLCLKKHDEAIALLFYGIYRWVKKFENRFSQKSLEIITDYQYQLEYEVMRKIKRVYKLGDEIKMLLI
jgi:hypothetical protein